MCVELLPELLPHVGSTPTASNSQKETSVNMRYCNHCEEAMRPEDGQRRYHPPCHREVNRVKAAIRRASKRKRAEHAARDSRFYQKNKKDGAVELMRSVSRLLCRSHAPHEASVE